MTTRTVSLIELPEYVGRYISYGWSDGWDDYNFSGYLHGIDGEGYVFIDDRAELEPDERWDRLGGVRCDSRETFEVYISGPPSWARRP